jgi:putative endonuclease
MKQYYVYILSSYTRTLYIGVSNNIKRRVVEHKEKQIEGFTKRYNVDRLVYFETFREVNDALAREKQLKKWSRKKKIELIEGIIRSGRTYRLSGRKRQDFSTPLVPRSGRNDTRGDIVLKVLLRCH